MDIRIKQAEQFLRDILLDPKFKPWQPTKVLINTAKQKGIPREAVHLAKKDIGVISIAVDGKQYWALPERIEVSND